MNGGSCIKCSFKEKMAEFEIKLQGCPRGYETSIRYKARIDEAEEIFDDVVELILDREYAVRSSQNLKTNHNYKISAEKQRMGKTGRSDNSPAAGETSFYNNKATD